jgi:predicted AAA+ superfamily ATPase
MKDISDQEVGEHLKRLNRWWSGGGIDAENAKLRPRAYLPAVHKLLTDVSLRRAVVLLGPRRVGKTVLIRHLIGDLLAAGVPATRIGYVEVDHPLLHGQSLDTLVTQMLTASGDAGEGLRYLFFDEIQYLKDWERHLKALVDHRADLRILVSGSAAAALRRQSTESGAGRFTDFLLPPLTFSEYLALSPEPPAIREVGEERYALESVERLNEQFVDYVNFGGYPELALSPAVRADPERFVKSDIIDKVLLRDLPQLYGIQDIQELNALFTLLAYNSGEQVSLEGLAQRSGVSKATIGRYIEYLEAAFLLKRVFRVDQSGRRYQRERAFKIYLTNPAMRTGLFGPVSADDEGFGHVVETAVFAQRFHDDARLNYAHWGAEDCEVDLVESSAALKPVLAVEIKWSDRYVDRPQDLHGIVRFGRASGLSEAWVTTRSRFGRAEVDGLRLIYWPTAVLAFHFGILAVKGRLSMSGTKIENAQGVEAQ